MHTILGANGSIGRELSRCLAVSGQPIRQVGRTPQQVNPTDEVMYQFGHDYRFDSSKIEAAYGLEPTSYRAGIAAALAA